MHADKPRQEFVTFEGVSLSIKRTGRGEPVVCLPAVGHDALDFAPLAERLGSAFEFICIEWPGHGQSGPDRVPASATRYSELLEAALPRLGIGNPILLGNSIGGAVAIYYAARHKVRALVLCDSAGLVEINAKVVKFCRLFSRFFAAGARGAWWFKPLFGLYYRNVLPSRPALAQRQRIIASAYRVAPVLAQAWQSFGKPAADIRELAAQLTVPIWIAWARRDRVIPLRVCRPAIERLKHASLDVFDGGHSAFLEQPDEFAAKFQQFVSRLGADAQSPDTEPALATR